MKMTDKDLSLLRSVPNEIIKYKIQELKNKLKETDYKALQFAEGEKSEEEFAPIRTQRRLWREEINELEREMLTNKI